MRACAIVVLIVKTNVVWIFKMKKLIIVMMSFGMFGCDESKEHPRTCYYDNGFLKHVNLEEILGL